LIAIMAVTVCTALRLDAVVIDDFEDGVQYAEGGGGTNEFIWGLSNGQLVVYTNAPSPGQRYDNVYWPAPSLPEGNLEEGRTLEIRLDLNHTSTDDLFLLLMCGGLNAGEDSVYGVFIDQNEVALSKYRYQNFTTFYWDTLATTNENVTVKLALTRTNSSLAITVKVVDKGNQHATLYERTFVDGPGQDGPVPPPDPHGIGVFTPDAGAPLTNFTYAAAGCWRVVCTDAPPLEMLLDNLEYDVYHPPHLEIAQATNGVDLNWMLPMEEHIVVEADQLGGPWCPCWQPYTQTGDAFCLTTPCQAQQKFFKLTPGTQFTDDFSSLVPSWTPWPFGQPLTTEWVVTNGILQVHLPEEHETNSWEGLVLAPLGATNVEALLRDVSASVDILDWQTSSTNLSGCYLWARGYVHPTAGNGYFGVLFLNHDGIPGRILPMMFTPSGESRGAAFDIATFPPPYRLQFSVVGNKLSFRVLNATTGQLIREVPPMYSLTYSVGVVGLFFNADTATHDSYILTLDNFFMNGTKPLTRL
jgi:hypothetical protein